MEKFEAEKLIIKIRVRKLFQTPLRELVARMPQMSREEYDKTMEIFWHKCGKYPAIHREDFCTISAVFPALLAAIAPDFSRERVEFLAEFSLEEAKNRRLSPKKDLIDPE